LKYTNNPSDNQKNIGRIYHNSSTAPSDHQADLSKIPSLYQLYWYVYQAQEAYFAKGKITEAEFLAVKGYFSDADLSSASIFANGLGGQA
jgi:hypothetical protein